MLKLEDMEQIFRDFDVSLKDDDAQEEKKIYCGNGRRYRVEITLNIRRDGGNNNLRRPNWGNKNGTERYRRFFTRGSSGASGSNG